MMHTCLAENTTNLSHRSWQTVIETLSPGWSQTWSMEKHLALRRLCSFHLRSLVRPGDLKLHDAHLSRRKYKKKIATQLSTHYWNIKPRLVTNLVHGKTPPLAKALLVSSQVLRHTWGYQNSCSYPTCQTPEDCTAQGFTSKCYPPPEPCPT